MHTIISYLDPIFNTTFHVKAYKHLHDTFGKFCWLITAVEEFPSIASSLFEFCRDCQFSVLCNLFTPKFKALNLSMHRNNKNAKIRERREFIHVTVVEKYTLDGAATFTSMKHKHRRHTH